MNRPCRIPTLLLWSLGILLSGVAVVICILRARVIETDIYFLGLHFEISATAIIPNVLPLGVACFGVALARTKCRDRDLVRKQQGVNSAKSIVAVVGGWLIFQLIYILTTLEPLGIRISPTPIFFSLPALFIAAAPCLLAGFFLERRPVHSKQIDRITKSISILVLSQFCVWLLVGRENLTSKILDEIKESSKASRSSSQSSFEGQRNETFELLLCKELVGKLSTSEFQKLMDDLANENVGVITEDLLTSNKEKDPGVFCYCTETLWNTPLWATVEKSYGSHSWCSTTITHEYIFLFGFWKFAYQRRSWEEA